MKMAKPTSVPTIAVPSSRRRRRSAVARRAADAVDLVVNVLGRVLERGVEGEPHADADEGHDQHGDGGGDDALAALVAAEVPARRSGAGGGHGCSFQALAKRRRAARNGTARRITPGTRVATLTGIHTCWDRRSTSSVVRRCSSRRA